jgi:hypothetical protein
MRTPRALLHAMRNRRTHRIGPAEADALVTGDHNGPSHTALQDLLDAVRAPGTAEELSGEKDVVAAFTEHRRRVARAASRRPARTRTAVVAVAAGLALLVFGGTAVAARTGRLPTEAQQHAHRLFSALGVPAPRTGPASESPSPSSSRSAPVIVALDWCDAWGRRSGGTPLSTDDRRKLLAAAGGADGVEKYCAGVRKSASASASPSSAPASPRPSSPAPSGTDSSGPPPPSPLPSPADSEPDTTPAPSVTPSG